MGSKGLSLVTGANGHLGNNLVRALLAQGAPVRAMVRQLGDSAPFQGLACERVQGDLMDPASLQQALAGVEVLYQVAAVFRHWARDPQQEIIRPNVEGTRHVLQAAAAAGVKKVVYVSSVAAVGHDGTPRDESHWSEATGNAYFDSKIQSERMAWATAQALGLPMVAVLPAAMVGPHAYRLTDTMNFLEVIRQQRLPVDPDFRFNFVDVRDVAEACVAAAERGRTNERYILANVASSPLAELVAAAGSVSPRKGVPPRAPRWLLMALARTQEAVARVTGRPAELLASQVRLFHGVSQEFSSAKAGAELGYRPRPPEQALREAFRYLQEREQLTAGRPLPVARTAP